MANKFRNRKVLIESDTERRLRLCLERALAHDWSPRRDGDGASAGRILVFANRYEIARFFDLMMREGDEGCVTGATVFAAKALEIDRPVRSRFLTLLARTLYETAPDMRGPIQESEVAWFAPFVNALLARKQGSRDDRMDGLVLAWVEDMNATDPENDLEPQPTAVIRGVLFAPSFDQRQAFGFWERASRSERFPDRIFSDPDHPDAGGIFSSYHLRAFGLFFSVAPEGAVSRFAAHMRDRALMKRIVEWVADLGKWIVRDRPATENERNRVFDGIVGYVDGEKRREQLQTIFRAA